MKLLKRLIGNLLVGFEFMDKSDWLISLVVLQLNGFWSPLNTNVNFQSVKDHKVFNSLRLRTLELTCTIFLCISWNFKIVPEYFYFFFFIFGFKIYNWAQQLSQAQKLCDHFDLSEFLSAESELYWIREGDPWKFFLKFFALKSSRTHEQVKYIGTISRTENIWWKNTKHAHKTHKRVMKLIGMKLFICFRATKNGPYAHLTRNQANFCHEIGQNHKYYPNVWDTRELVWWHNPFILLGQHFPFSFVIENIVSPKTLRKTNDHVDGIVCEIDMIIVAKRNKVFFSL